MTTQDQLVKTLSAGNYEVRISHRESSVRFPNHKAHCLYIQNTPKSRFSPYKIIHSYVYKDVEEAITVATKWIENIQCNINQRSLELSKRREANRNIVASDFYKVGDIVVNTWGYDQTNIEFYKVEKVMNKMIFVKELSLSSVQGSESFMSCSVVPTDIYKEGGMEYKLVVKAEGRLSNPESYYYMHKWSGKPLYMSWYA